MIEKLIETKTPSVYSDKVFNYSQRYEETKFKALDELISLHSHCRDYAMAYSGLSDYVSYHFPATSKDRTIYRQKVDKKPSVGIYIFPMKGNKDE